MPVSVELQNNRINLHVSVGAAVARSGHSITFAGDAYHKDSLLATQTIQHSVAELANGHEITNPQDITLVSPAQLPDDVVRVASASDHYITVPTAGPPSGVNCIIADISAGPADDPFFTTAIVWMNNTGRSAVRFNDQNDYFYVAVRADIKSRTALIVQKGNADIPLNMTVKWYYGRLGSAAEAGGLDQPQVEALLDTQFADLTNYPAALTRDTEAQTIAVDAARARFTDAEKTKLAALTNVFRPRGTYASNTAYAVNDVVAYNNHLYYVAAAIPSSNTSPPVDGSTWILLSADPTPTATTTRQGTVELATQAEMNAGSANRVPDAQRVKAYADTKATISEVNARIATPARTGDTSRWPESKIDEALVRTADLPAAISANLPANKTLLVTGNVDLTSVNRWATDSNTPDFTIPGAIPDGEIWGLSFGVLSSGSPSIPRELSIQLFDASYFNSMTGTSRGVFGDLINATGERYIELAMPSISSSAKLYLGKDTATNKLLVASTAAQDPTPLTIWRMNYL